MDNIYLHKPYLGQNLLQFWNCIWHKDQCALNGFDNSLVMKVQTLTGT